MAAVPQIIAPYGGRLVNLVVNEADRASLKRHANSLPFLQISQRTLCDLEMLATGALSPLDRFMGEADYRNVLATMCLCDGHLSAIPVTLPAREGEFQIGQEIALRDASSEVLALIRIDEIFRYDAREEQLAVLGSDDSSHPLVAEMSSWGKVYLSGPLTVIKLPEHYDFPELRLTPSQVRERLAAWGNDRIVAFHTRNPMHRAHEEIAKRAMDQLGANLLIHPAVGVTKPGDVDHYTRVRTYRTLVENYFPSDRTLLSLCPMAMRMAGPRSAVWHAMIRRNYGASHFIVGRDHEGPGVNSQGEPYYRPFEAQELVTQYADELGVGIVNFKEFVYSPARKKLLEADEVEPGEATETLSGTQVRDEYLAAAKPLPEWFTRPETARILAQAYPPKIRQGVCVWLTGLPSSGKSTVANILSILLLEHGRGATLLDGDVVRTHLSKGLGFSKEDRDTNILRIGFVAGEIARAGGIVITAAVSPYESTRSQVRHMFPINSFVEVYINTPLRVCEERDVKGLYHRARLGEARGVTGIDDPYEAPAHAEIVIDTVAHSAEVCARQIANYLKAQGFIE